MKSIEIYERNGACSPSPKIEQTPKNTMNICNYTEKLPILQETDIKFRLFLLLKNISFLISEKLLI